VREAAVPRQADDTALLLDQLLDRQPHLPDLPGALERRVVAGTAVERRRVGRFDAALASVDVDRGATGDGEQPRAEPLRGVEPRGGPPRVDERGLHGVGGPRRVAEDRQRHGEHGAAVALVRIAQHRVVAPRKPERELALRDHLPTPVTPRDAPTSPGSASRARTVERSAPY